jgi:hypothetical protein
MPFHPANDADLPTILSVLAVSIVSGFISISQRIVRGTGVTVLWICMEFAAAVLCGYLAWDAFPHIQKYLPDWITLPILVAACAHSGGRGLQGLERAVYQAFPAIDRRLNLQKRRPPNPK